jgi:hypothetical protein
MGDGKVALILDVHGLAQRSFQLSLQRCHAAREGLSGDVRPLVSSRRGVVWWVAQREPYDLDEAGGGGGGASPASVARARSRWSSDPPPCAYAPSSGC